jgi:hypothetical protein
MDEWELKKRRKVWTTEITAQNQPAKVFLE